MKVVNHQTLSVQQAPALTSRRAPSAEKVAVKRPVVVISYEKAEKKGYSHLKSPYQLRRESMERELDLRDQEVRLHEKNHFQTLGAYAASPVQLGTSSASGKSIAHSGRIKVDLAPVPGNPQATLQKARVLMSAAMAPGAPSAADHKIAAQAYQLQQDAMDELREQQKN